MKINFKHYLLIAPLLFNGISASTFAENVPYVERFLLPTNKKEAVILAVLLSSFWFFDYKINQSVKKFREDTTNKFREKLGGNILNSSYVVYYRPDKSMPSEVSFYAYDGSFIENFIVSMFLNANPIWEDLLDPKAPKPQPVTYAIKKLPIKKFFGFGILYRYFIIFYDKNGNEIQRYHYDKNNQKIITKKGESYDFPSLKISLDFPLDLSKVQEKQ